MVIKISNYAKDKIVLKNKMILWQLRRKNTYLQGEKSKRQQVYVTPGCFIEFGPPVLP